MTNEELIAKIKAKIERLKATNPSEYNYQNAEGYVWALDDIFSFLSTIESEKPTQEGLEEEIQNYNKERLDEYFPEQDGDFISEVDFMTCLDRVARHFAQWGAEHLKK